MAREKSRRKLAIKSTPLNSSALRRVEMARTKPTARKSTNGLIPHTVLAAAQTARNQNYALIMRTNNTRLSEDSEMFMANSAARTVFVNVVYDHSSGRSGIKVSQILGQSVRGAEGEESSSSKSFVSQSFRCKECQLHGGPLS
jgi:hypothetical protein